MLSAGVRAQVSVTTKLHRDLWGERRCAQLCMTLVSQQAAADTVGGSHSWHKPSFYDTGPWSPWHAAPLRVTPGRSSAETGIKC